MTTKKARELKLTAVKTAEGFTPETIRCGEDAQRYARQFYFDDIEIYESLFIILLNTRNRTIGWAKISQGGTASTTVDRKLIAKFAVDSLAHGVIVVHNHPSGNLLPSPQDDAMTKAVAEGLKFLDIKLLDSIILAPEAGQFYSFSDNGRL